MLHLPIKLVFEKYHINIYLGKYFIYCTYKNTVTLVLFYLPVIRKWFLYRYYILLNVIKILADDTVGSLVIFLCSYFNSIIFKTSFIKENHVVAFLSFCLTWLSQKAGHRNAVSGSGDGSINNVVVCSKV